VALVEAMITGLTGGQEYFPAPPVTAVQLGTLRTAYVQAKNSEIGAQSIIAQMVAQKDEKLTALVEGMKSDLRYAENAVNYDDEILKLLGWGGRKPPTPLQPPGQTRSLIVHEQGEGWVKLEWKAPIDGGKPSAYRILRRERPSGPWNDCATAVVCDATLLDQPRGKEYEYRVVAVNKAGEGESSNTVVVVL
jgi:hypothetical protein